MPFLTASANVAAVLAAGGLRYAEQLIDLGFSASAIVERLRERYTLIGGAPYNVSVYAAVRDRALAAQLAGERMMGKCLTLPCARDLHVGAPGLSTAYEYQVQIIFRDPATGREYMPTFAIGSADAMSGESILGRASQLARSLLATGETPKGSVTVRPDFEIYSITIRDALVRI